MRETFKIRIFVKNFDIQSTDLLGGKKFSQKCQNATYRVGTCTSLFILFKKLRKSSKNLNKILFFRELCDSSSLADAVPLMGILAHYTIHCLKSQR